MSILFIATDFSWWKYDRVLELMKQDARFRVNVVVVTREEWHSEGESAKVRVRKELNYFRAANVAVESCFDEHGEVVDPVIKYHPDVVFYSVPYNYIDPLYHHYRFKKSLICYAPYAFVVIPRVEYHYASDFYQFLWIYFVESKIHDRYRKSFLKNPFSKTVISGYVGLNGRGGADLAREDSRTCVVWAPHHTIDGCEQGLGYGTFLRFAESILSFAKANDVDFKFILKPHPLLWDRLKRHWSTTEISHFLQAWCALGHCELSQGHYHEVFYQSDCMIHDCASFLVEYLIEGKPVMFLRNADSNFSGFNEFGDLAFQTHEVGWCEDDIWKFLWGVRKGLDKNGVERESFLIDHLKLDNDEPSKIVIQELQKLL